MTDADNSRFRPYDRNDGGAEPNRNRSDPLAELARLIGETDHFGQRVRDAHSEPPGDYGRYDEPTPEPAWHPDPAPVEHAYDPPPAPQQAHYSHQADHQVEYGDEHRADHHDDDQVEYRDEHRADHRDDDQVEYRGDRRVDRRDAHQVEYRDAATADLFERTEPAYQPPPRYEPVVPPFAPAPPRYQSVAPRYQPVAPRFEHDAQPDEAKIAPRYSIPGFPRDDEEPPHADIHAAPPPEPAIEPEELAIETPPPPEQRNRWRPIGLVLVGLAALGSGGAFAYRGYFGNTMKFTLPPIIHASTEPTKVAPPPVKSETTANKITYDRFGDRTQNEKVVAREEKPVDPKNLVTAPPAAAVVPPSPVSPFPPMPKQSEFPAVQAPAAPQPQPPAVRPSVSPAPTKPPAAAAAQAPNPPSVLTEPKRVRTVAVKPDVQNTATPLQPAVPSTPAPNRRLAANAPLSLSPQATSTAPAPSRPARTATPPTHAATPPTRVATAPAAPVTTASTRGHYLVQVSSQRSEGDAQTAFRSIKAKYASVLGSHSPVIRRADLGAKGVYYRAMVGPFSTREQAVQLCANLKAAGGACVVQSN